MQVFSARPPLGRGIYSIYLVKNQPETHISVAQLVQNYKLKPLIMEIRDTWPLLVPRDIELEIR